MTTQGRAPVGVPAGDIDRNGGGHLGPLLCGNSDTIMTRHTLLDFFNDLSLLQGSFLSYDDGYRFRSYSYREIFKAGKEFAGKLRGKGFQKGEKVIFWAENRPEWVSAFWGCLLEGVVVVPIDFRSSADFVRKVRAVVQSRLVLAGEEVAPLTFDDETSVWRLADLHDAAFLEPPACLPAPITRDDVAEIIFTSGATAEPKGVIITHRNLLANIVPVETEMAKYRKYARPFSPIRFLNVLPLSHLFGQAMAMFIPPLLSGTVVFMRGYNPDDIVRLVRSRRISILVGVPKILDVLREYMIRRAPLLTEMSGPKPHVARRWWRYRRIHRMLGWKFWSFVVGAAPLDPELEEFWSRLGYLVVQGYGLTETAPIVSLNHPLNARKGSVGKAMPGVEVKIASDGEILVRGENVTSGYFMADHEAAEVFEGGWFHTGDIGSVDAEGRLYIQGRKKEMIVTPEGLNVFPEDVERVLNSISGVRESAVVGVSTGGEERVHAVLVLETAGPKKIPRVHPAEILRLANSQLADQQRIRGMTVWPDETLPRTEGTQKLKRRHIKGWIEKGLTPPPPASAGSDPLLSILRKFAGDRPLEPQTTLEELGLSSLERVELLLELEDHFGAAIDEAAFSEAHDIASLRALIEGGAGEPSAAMPSRVGDRTGEVLEMPDWPRRGLVRLLRRMLLMFVILPLTRLFAWLRIRGRENLKSIQGPVIFASNHQSHMDTPVILAALPRRWRYRVSPAMSKEFFVAHFHPDQFRKGERWTSSLQYYLAAALFNAFPLPQREAGVRETLRHIGELVGGGYSVLIFPEGRRSDAGEINSFQPGVAMMASRLEVPVVPVRIEGLDRVLHHTWKMARPGFVRITIGSPLHLRGGDYAALAREIEEAVRKLGYQGE